MNSDLFNSHTMFKHLHGRSIKDKENINDDEQKDTEFNKMRRSLKFKEKKEKKPFFEKNKNFFLSPNKKFNSLRKSIKYEEEQNEFHKKRRYSEKTFQTRKNKRDNSKSIFSSKRLSSQFNNGLLH